MSQWKRQKLGMKRLLLTCHAWMIRTEPDDSDKHVDWMACFLNYSLTHQSAEIISKTVTNFSLRLRSEKVSLWTISTRIVMSEKWHNFLQRASLKKYITSRSGKKCPLLANTALITHSQKQDNRGRMTRMSAIFSAVLGPRCAVASLCTTSPLL